MLERLKKYFEETRKLKEKKEENRGGKEKKSDAGRRG